MVATTWSDSDTSSSNVEEEKVEERANLCLMAKEDASEVEGSTYKTASLALQTEDSRPGIDQPTKAPSLEQNKKESGQGTEVIGSVDENPPSEPQPQPEPQPSLPHFEEVSIMELFYQMVHEEQAEKEAAKEKTKPDTSASAPTTEGQSEKGKANTTTALQVKSKPPGKCIKTMVTKSKFFKRRKSSRLVEKAKPVNISSSQNPVEVFDKSSPEPSPQKSPPQPSPQLESSSTSKCAIWY
ncbi:PREDICTED: putative uncharacterized protein DDB_G0272516 [Theobroma cacao]|uniref:Uncharacterized protein n=1 Tax=Theobroma cacao TaxID=3641 RepID=A0AB32X2E5_THECC|nr:PREDICTED: putative uncharacterized protein DDB_G0272516 [Theobroma cacao]